jgi:hypothetical protein
VRRTSSRGGAVITVEAIGAVEIPGGSPHTGNRPVGRSLVKFLWLVEFHWDQDALSLA